MHVNIQVAGGFLLFFFFFIMLAAREGYPKIESHALRT